MSTRRLIALLLLVSVLVIAVISVIINVVGANMERPLVDGQNIIWEENYHLNTVVEGDMVVIAANITFGADSVVNGNVSLFGENLTIDGIINGSVTTFSQNLTLGEGGALNGKLSAFGDSLLINGALDGAITFTGQNITIAESAAVVGAVSVCADTVHDQRPEVTVFEDCSARAIFQPFTTLIALRDPNIQVSDVFVTISPIIGLMFSVAGALILACISALALMLFPRQISCIEEAIRVKPRKLGGAGFATYVLLVGITIGMIVLLALLPPLGLILLPIYLLLGIVLLAFFIAGWVTLSLIVGDWLVSRFNSRRARLSTQRIAPPFLTATLGSLMLSAVVLGLTWLLPFGVLIVIGLVISLSSIGIGAALFTRLGTKSLNRSYFVQG